MQPINVRLRQAIGAGALCALAVGGSANAGECLSHARQAEREYQIPAGLVQAIAQIESGHNPWAIAVGTQTVIPGTQEEAVKVLRSRPVKGIFVGCMQLSLKHHAWAFDSKLNMLDPAENVDYGAGLLAELREKSGTWAKAVQRYQGGTPAAQRRYACKVAARLKLINPASAALPDFRACGKPPAKQQIS